MKRNFSILISYFLDWAYTSWWWY